MVASLPIFYLIPGLGADERVFQFLRLRGEVHVLRWLPTQNAAEALPHYAARLAAAIPPEQACWLVGVSFGGVSGAGSSATASFGTGSAHFQFRRAI